MGLLFNPQIPKGIRFEATLTVHPGNESLVAGSLVGREDYPDVFNQFSKSEKAQRGTSSKVSSPRRLFQKTTLTFSHPAQAGGKPSEAGPTAMSVAAGREASPAPNSEVYK